MTDQSSKPRFCSECGTKFLSNAKFCHNCGKSVDGATARSASAPLSPALKFGLPLAALVALVAMSLYRANASGNEQPAVSTPLASAATGQPPDISSMSPEERADRLFNRVMSMWSEGKRDSAQFFAPMAMAAIGSLTPLDAHRRYDLGLVSLVAGDPSIAKAQSDSILRERPQHLLGLLLAARAADARGDSSVARDMRSRLVAAEKSERASGLQEYTDHDADLRGAIEEARKR